MKTPWIQSFLVVWLVLGWSAGGQETELVDRIVAVVAEDPILQSDLDRVIGLGLVSRRSEESQRSFHRRVLDEMIDEKLRFHEIDRFGFSDISRLEVDREFDKIRSRFASEAEFEARLAQLGMTADDIRQLVARQLMVLTYVDERLGPRVFVDQRSIESYYESVLVPELRGKGAPIPQLQDVREDIRAVLREQRLNEELEHWTDELRAETDVEDYFEVESAELPDLVLGSAESRSE